METIPKPPLGRTSGHVPAAPLAPAQRSRIANGSALVLGPVNGNTAEARRHREVYEALVTALPGPHAPTAPVLILVRQAATLAVDLQAHLSWVADEIRERLGIQSTTIPDIYLAGNRTLFEEVAAAAGTIVGFEAGFYRKSGNRPGIYMRTDFLRTNILRLLNHEYVHLVLDEISLNLELPSWLNEGTARYFEYTLNL